LGLKDRAEEDPCQREPAALKAMAEGACDSMWVCPGLAELREVPGWAGRIWNLEAPHPRQM
jgi:hypothetical protein